MQPRSFSTRLSVESPSPAEEGRRGPHLSGGAGLRPHHCFHASGEVTYPRRYTVTRCTASSTHRAVVIEGLPSRARNGCVRDGNWYPASIK
jgi:hypothetical protein